MSSEGAKSRELMMERRRPHGKKGFKRHASKQQNTSSSAQAATPTSTPNNADVPNKCGTDITDNINSNTTDSVDNVSNANATNAASNVASNAASAATKPAEETPAARIARLQFIVDRNTIVNNGGSHIHPQSYWEGIFARQLFPTAPIICMPTTEIRAVPGVYAFPRTSDWISGVTIRLNESGGPYIINLIYGTKIIESRIMKESNQVTFDAILDMRKNPFLDPQQDLMPQLAATPQYQFGTEDERAAFISGQYSRNFDVINAPHSDHWLGFTINHTRRYKKAVFFVTIHYDRIW
jgi:hypothetical protein